MGVSSTTNTEIYNGDGTSVSFPFPFYFFLTTNLFVYIYETVAKTITLKTPGTDYTVTGTPNAQGLYPNGGNVIMGVAPSNIEMIVISRFPIETQNYALLQNGVISSVAIVQQFDYLTLLIQSLQDQHNRALQLPAGYAPAFNTNLPVSLPAGATLVVNNTGDGLATGPTVDFINDQVDLATAEAIIATAAAAAAAADAAAAASSAAEAAASAGASFQEIPTGLINSSNVSFSVSRAPDPLSAFYLFKDGQILVQGTDYNISGAIITMTTAPLFAESLYAIFAVRGQVVENTIQESPTPAADGSTVAFTLSQPPVSIAGLILFLDGRALVPGGGNNFTLSGAVITMTVAPAVGQKLWAVYNPVIGASPATVLVVDGSRGSPQLITAAGGLSFAGTQDLTKKYIAGNGGAVVVTANPQIAAGTTDGQELNIQGRSATNTVELQNGNGLVMNGPFFAALDNMITFSWDMTNWVEKSRQ